MPSEKAAWENVKEAMSVLEGAVGGDKLGIVELVTVLEWEKGFRDLVRDFEKRKRAEGRKPPKVKREATAVRKQLRAERKIEQGVRGIVRTRKTPVGSTTMEQAYALMDELNKEVMSRDVKELVETDVPAIEAIGHHLATASIYADTLSPHSVDEVPSVMTRLSLYAEEGIEVRLHMFPDLAETYIHNHRNNFVSMCLYGCYTHNIWSTVDGGSHYATSRSGDGTLTPLRKEQGSLSIATSYTHSTNKVFFLNKETHHTVQVVPSTTALPGTLTLYVKGKLPGIATTVLCPDARFEDTPQTTDHKLTGDARTSAIKEMTAMLRMAAADHYRTPV